MRIGKAAVLVVLLCLLACSCKGAQESEPAYFKSAVRGHVFEYGGEVYAIYKNMVFSIEGPAGGADSAVVSGDALYFSKRGSIYRTAVRADGDLSAALDEAEKITAGVDLWCVYDGLLYMTEWEKGVTTLRCMDPVTGVEKLIGRYTQTEAPVLISGDWIYCAGGGLCRINISTGELELLVDIEQELGLKAGTAAVMPPLEHTSGRLYFCVAAPEGMGGTYSCEPDGSDVKYFSELYIQAVYDGVMLLRGDGAAWLRSHGGTFTELEAENVGIAEEIALTDEYIVLVPDVDLAEARSEPTFIARD